MSRPNIPQVAAKLSFEEELERALVTGEGRFLSKALGWIWAAVKNLKWGPLLSSPSVLYLLCNPRYTTDRDGARTGGVALYWNGGDSVCIRRTPGQRLQLKRDFAADSLQI
jgi:hypothetical protein